MTEIEALSTERHDAESSRLADLRARKIRAASNCLSCARWDSRNGPWLRLRPVHVTKLSCQPLNSALQRA